MKVIPTIVHSANVNLWLASKSPRRAELLSQIQVPFELLSVAVEESPGAVETAADFNLRVACDKALAGAAVRSQPAPVLGADTEVALNQRIFGKPESADQAREMLGALSGNTHQVYSSVALVNSQGELKSAQQVSKVTFDKLSPQRIDAYIASAEYQGRAGSYAIQGLGSSLVAHIEGSYSGVMGLPLFETIPLLRWAGAVPDKSPLSL